MGLGAWEALAETAGRAAASRDPEASCSPGRRHQGARQRRGAVGLRERSDDIELLARAFLAEYCAENNVAPKTLDDGVVAALRRYPWPGNVRELRNQVERMVIMCPGETVHMENLTAELREGVSSIPRGGSAGASGAGNYRGLPLLDARKRFEHDLIVEALERNDWNVSRAADELGIERTNLHKKMKMLGVSRGDVTSGS